MRAWRTVWLIAAVACAVGRAGAQGETPSSARPPRNDATAESGRTFIGVMGQVARPGVYRFPGGGISLRELVDEAGGLTVNATGNIRIIRGGRAGLQTFYSSTAVYELQAGDVVIASERTARRVPRGRSAQRGENRGPEAIQAALVGLLNRPVILKVSRPFATVGGIVSSVGQRRDGIVAVLEPPSSRLSRTEGVADEMLPTGTVLVFDPRAVDHSRVPPQLPKPYLVDLSPGESRADDAPELTADRSELAPALATNGNPTHEPISEPMLPGPTFHESDRRPSVPASLGGSLVATARESSAGPAIATESNTVTDSDGRLNQSQSRRTLIADSAADERASKTSLPIAANVPAAHSPESADERNGNPQTSDDGPGGRRPVVLIAALVCGLLVVGSLVVWGFGRRRPLPALEEVSAPAPIQNSLEALIQDELPIIEEHVRLPASITLHGTPKKVAPVRIDAPQAVTPPPPHQRPVVGRTVAGSEEASQASLAPGPLPATGTAKRHRVDGPRASGPAASQKDGSGAAVPNVAAASDASSRASAFERALLRVHGGSSR